LIVEFTEDRVKEIAKAQVHAWKAAFKGILSEKLLSSLVIENFAENWKKILTQKERKNYIWLDESGEGVGFVSYGKPKMKNEIADFEIYGIYVHPKCWGKRIGYKLMDFAIDKLAELNPSAKIILWTMEQNELSKKFYHRFGFIENGKHRISKRNDESFEEIQFEIVIENNI